MHLPKLSLRKRLLSAVFGISFISAACSGDSVGRSVTRLDEVGPGETCAAGGTAILVGPDANGNGALDGDEAASGTQRVVCNQVQAPQLASRVLVTQLTPGADCKYGGQKIQSGLDDDGNGALGASEVDSTQLVCNGRSLDVMHFGNVNVTRASDLDVLKGKEILIGDLDVDGTRIPNVTFPDLQQVSGGIEIWADWNDEEDLDGAEIMKTVSFPELTSLNYLELGLDPLETVSFPKLARVEGEAYFYGGRKISTLTLPALTYANELGVNDAYSWDEHDGLVTVSLPELTRFNRLAAHYNESLRTFSLPKVGAKDFGALRFYANSGITELSFPNMEEATEISLEYNYDLETFSAPKLKTVSDSIVFHDHDELVTVELPELETAGYLHFSDQDQLESVSLPKLSKLTNGMHMRYNSVLATVSMPEATEAGYLEIYGNNNLETFTVPKLAVRYWANVYSNSALSRCTELELEAQALKKRINLDVYAPGLMADSSCNTNTLKTCFALENEGVETKFQICRVEENFTSAQATCGTLFPGATLATFHTQAEFAMFQSHFRGENGYRFRPAIGFTDVSVDGTWGWMDGAVDFLPLNTDTDFWAATEPNGGTGENCTALWSADDAASDAGKAWDVDCSYDFRFVCRVP